MYANLQTEDSQITRILLGSYFRLYMFIHLKKKLQTILTALDMFCYVPLI